jgi:tRNA(adenine34) deaminase
MNTERYHDEFFMRKALEEAMIALEDGEIPVGSVVVYNNQIIGKGHNSVEVLNDVTAHAEILAISAAGNYLGSKYLEDCRIYITLEPCAMCAAAINAAQLKEIIYGAKDPKKGFSLYIPSLLHPKSKVKKGIMEEECMEILNEFFKKKRRNR